SSSEAHREDALPWPRRSEAEVHTRTRLRPSAAGGGCAERQGRQAPAPAVVAGGDGEGVDADRPRAVWPPGEHLDRPPEHLWREAAGEQRDVRAPDVGRGGPADAGAGRVERGMDLPVELVE